MTRATKKEEEAILTCYRRLFREATPGGDFDAMRDNGDIPYEDHRLSMDRQNKIIDEVIKEYKIPKHRSDMFRATIHLGCSPVAG